MKNLYVVKLQDPKTYRIFDVEVYETSEMYAKERALMMYPGCKFFNIRRG